MADATKWGYYQDVLVQENTEYTFSIDVKKTLWMECRALTVSISQDGTITPTGIVANSGWDAVISDNSYDYNNRRYVKTFNTLGYRAYRFFIYGYNVVTGQGATKAGMVNHPQLEIGNKATDWTPSPLDNEEEIASKASQDDVDMIITGGAKNLLKNTKITEDNCEAFPSTDNFRDESKNGWSFYNVSLNEEYSTSGDMWDYTDTDDNYHELWGYQLWLYNDKVVGSGKYYSNACLYQDVYLKKNTDYVFSTYSMEGVLPWVKCMTNIGYAGEGVVWDSKDFTWDKIVVDTHEGVDICRVYKTFNTGDDSGLYRFMIYGACDYDAEWMYDGYVSGINYLQLEVGVTPTEWEEGFDALTIIQSQLASTIVRQNTFDKALKQTNYSVDSNSRAIKGFISGNKIFDSEWNESRKFLPSQSISKKTEQRWVSDNTPTKESGWGVIGDSWGVSAVEHHNGIEDFIQFPRLEFDYDSTGETHSAGDIKYLDGGVYQDLFLDNNSTYTFSVLTYDVWYEGYGAFIDCKALDYDSSTHNYSVVPNTGFNIQEWEKFSGTKDWTFEYSHQTPVDRVYVTFNTGNYNYYRLRVYGAVYWESATSMTKYYSYINRFSLRKADGTEYEDRSWVRNEEQSLSNLFYNSSVDGILNTFYPVGSYYETSDRQFNPNDAWGGIWELETAGQVHVSGAATGTYTISGALTNTTDGGATTHNHGGTTGGHTLTAAESGVPQHTHPYSDSTYTLKTTNRKPGTSTAVAYGTSITRAATSRTSSNNTAADAASAHNHTITSNSNMQPYIVVYRWHRTA